MFWHTFSCMLWHIRAYIFALLCHNTSDVHYAAFLRWHISAFLLWHFRCVYLYCSGIFAAFTLTISYYHEVPYRILWHICCCVVILAYSKIIALLCHITCGMLYVALLLWNIRFSTLWHIHPALFVSYFLRPARWCHINTLIVSCVFWHA